MLLLALLACQPASIVQDTGALRPACEPNLPSFVMPIAPGSTSVAVEHHLGLCSDERSSMGRLSLRRTTPNATCQAILTFVGVGETRCAGCAGAWSIEGPYLDSDCPTELVDMSLGPEDLVISPWIGWSTDGTVHGENTAGMVDLPAYSNDYAARTEGPESWVDVYGASLLDR
jgi:hypothetical protein